MIDNSFTPQPASGTKLAETESNPVTDKKGYARRWLFSTRKIDGLLALGMPHCKVGARRVRIVIAEADAWMREKFGTQRRRAAKKAAPAIVGG